MDHKCPLRIGRVLGTPYPNLQFQMVPGHKANQEHKSPALTARVHGAAWSYPNPPVCVKNILHDPPGKGVRENLLTFLRILSI